MTTPQVEPQVDSTKSYPPGLPWLILAVGLLVRLWFASYTFLNPDEALHYLLSVQPSLVDTYIASLSTAHPPLYLLLLHAWDHFGSSEFVLRLLSVFASIGFCALMFAWIKNVLDDTTALFVLILLAFSPPLVWLSAEVRQYAVLWLFAAGSLYFFDLAMQRDSPLLMLLSSIFLYLAILSHYSAFIAAAAIGTYGLLRIVTAKPPALISVLWIGSQLGTLAEVLFLLKSHVSKLRKEGLPQAIANSYLERSVFHPQLEGAIHFVIKSNVRVFHYFFAQGAVGVLALLIFVAGIVLLFKDRTVWRKSRKPAPVALGILFALPFVVNCALAVAGAYPYGGTRHDSYLSIFAMPAIAVALAHWKPSYFSTKMAVLALVLAACNLFPAALGEYLRPRDQQKKWMTQATDYLKQSAPPGSTIFTSDQGKLLLTYYLCRGNHIPYQEPLPDFLQSTCGGYRMIALSPDLWDFRSQTFADELSRAHQIFQLAPSTTLWFIQVGWYQDQKLRAELPQYGCRDPRQFGNNIFLCPLVPSSP